VRRFVTQSLGRRHRFAIDVMDTQYNALIGAAERLIASTG
jgi:hypothetical protein